MMRTPDYYTRALRSAAGMPWQARVAGGSRGFLSRMARGLPNDYYTRNM